MDRIEKNNFTRRSFLRQAALGGATLGASQVLSWGCAREEFSRSARSSTKSSRRPNILLIMTDQQTADAMSCVGNTDVLTPAMDSLAEAGVVFNKTYCTQSLCSPSRSSIFTSVMPHETDVVRNGLPIAEKYWAEEMGTVFSRVGYECGYAGKWHLPEGEIDEGHGFRRIAGMGDEEVAAQSIRFLRQNHTKPFLLVSSLHNPHDICQWARGEELPEGSIPDAPPEKWPSLPDNFAIPELEPSIIREAKDVCSKRIFPTLGWTEAQWRHYRYAYYRLVEKVDDLIGRVLQALRKSGLEEHTMVVFTSDHGDGVGAHQWNQKQILYEEEVRVPLIISYKGDTRAGVVDNDHLVSMGLDIYPTICEFAGIEPPECVRGRSLRSLAEGRRVAEWRDQVVAECIIGCEDVGVVGYGRMLRTERFKYLIYSRGEHREQLIDMKTDPGEMVNLAEDARYREVLDEHRRRLAQWCKETGDEFEVP